MTDDVVEDVYVPTTKHTHKNIFIQSAVDLKRHQDQAQGCSCRTDCKSIVVRILCMSGIWSRECITENENSLFFLHDNTFNLIGKVYNE